MRAYWGRPLWREWPIRPLGVLVVANREIRVRPQRIEKQGTFLEQPTGLSCILGVSTWMFCTGVLNDSQTCILMHRTAHLAHRTQRKRAAQQSHRRAQRHGDLVQCRVHKSSDSPVHKHAATHPPLPALPGTLIGRKACSRLPTPRHHTIFPATTVATCPVWCF